MNALPVIQTDVLFVIDGPLYLAETMGRAAIREVQKKCVTYDVSVCGVVVSIDRRLLVLYV